MCKKVNARNSPLFAQGKARWDSFVQSYAGPYDLTPATYTGMNHKIEFVCPRHGVQKMDAKNMISGKQCQKCSFEARKGKGRITQKKMLARFKDMHGDRYDYSLAVYSTQNTPVKIICHEHGLFEQKPEYHWTGSGCPKCYDKKRGGSQRDTKESFVVKAEAVFAGAFDYSNTVYVNSQTTIEVRCKQHDINCTTKPNWMLNGCNPCPSCNHMKSHKEQEVADFLSIFTKTECRNRSLIAPKELDIYLPEQQLAVEFCGDYWHSHGDVESEVRDRNKHITKHKLAAEQGVRLITIWGSEWDERQFAVKRLLRCAVGKLKGKLMARKCELRTVTHPEAVAFYERYHPQGGVGQGLHYGLYWKGKLVACMRFTQGANDRGAAKSRDWTLTRYATRVTVAGGASRLFKAFVREHNPKKVKSFSDNRYFSGGMYEQLGFVLEQESPADYTVWHQKLGLRPKSAWQRRNIPARAKELGLELDYDPVNSPESERDMTFMLGARRLYDCGKKRWVWTT